MNRKITFSELRSLLERLDFSVADQPTHHYFEHPPSNTIVMLRRYRPNESVNILDLASVRKALDERGLMSADSFERFLKKRSA